MSNHCLTFNDSQEQIYELDKIARTNGRLDFLIFKKFNKNSRGIFDLQI